MKEEFIHSRCTYKISFLVFQYGSGSSVKVIMPLSATISDWFEMFSISNSIIVIYKVNHTWIIFPRS